MYAQLFICISLYTYIYTDLSDFQEAFVSLRVSHLFNYRTQFSGTSCRASTEFSLRRVKARFIMTQVQAPHEAMKEIKWMLRMDDTILRQTTFKKKHNKQFHFDDNSAEYKARFEEQFEMEMARSSSAEKMDKLSRTGRELDEIEFN